MRVNIIFHDLGVVKGYSSKLLDPWLLGRVEPACNLSLDINICHIHNLCNRSGGRNFFKNCVWGSLRANTCNLNVKKMAFDENYAQFWLTVSELSLKKICFQSFPSSLLPFDATSWTGDNLMIVWSLHPCFFLGKGGGGIVELCGYGGRVGDRILHKLHWLAV